MFHYLYYSVTINPKMSRGRGGKIDYHPPHLVNLQKLCLIKRGWNSVFLTFDIVISHMFLDTFTETPQVFWTTWTTLRISLSILAIVINISYCHLTQFFVFGFFFWHFLVTKKLMTSEYNKWCQNFFTFNML